MDVPDDQKYSRDHEWVRVDENGIATVGITDFAQDQLGDIVYVELPEIGKKLAKGAEAAVVESVKAASEVFAPVSGEVAEVNGALSDEEMVRGLKDVVCAGDFIPVFCAAGGREIGILALLNDIVDLMPSPLNGPKRVAQGKGGEEELKASDTEPLAAYVWKTTADPFVGKMTYFRVFSGSIQADAHVWNQNKG